MCGVRIDERKKFKGWKLI